MAVLSNVGRDKTNSWPAGTWVLGSGALRYESLRARPRKRVQKQLAVSGDMENR